MAAPCAVTSRRLVCPSEITESGEHTQALCVADTIAEDIAAAVGDSAAAMVSVLGNSKGGKSSLSNLFAHGGSDWERGPFRVSGANGACTAGIDVSWPPAPGSSGPSTQLLWADCEGRGVRGTAYDLQLGTVAVAVSSVVVYNRTGTLAREDVMNDLKTLADAAARLCGSMEEAGGGAAGAAGPAEAAPSFGHLHIVVRDYGLDSAMGGLQFEAAHGAEQWGRIVAEERLPVNPRQRDAAVARNRSRAALQAAFKSITVWLMPQPTAEDPAMRVLFLRRVADLRAAVIAQASSAPATFGGSGQQHVITGRRLALLLPDIVRAANGRAPLAPASLFAEMQRRMCAAAAEEAEAVCSENLAVLQSEAVISSPSPRALRALVALWLDGPVLALKAKVAAVVGPDSSDSRCHAFFESLQLRVALLAMSCHQVRDRLTALLAESVVAAAQDAVRPRLDAAVAALTSLEPATEADASREHENLVAAFDAAADAQLELAVRGDAFAPLAPDAEAVPAAAAPGASPVGCDAFWDGVGRQLVLLHGDDGAGAARALAASPAAAAAATRAAVAAHPMRPVAHAALRHELTRAVLTSRARHAAAQVAAEQARALAAAALVRERRSACRAQALAVAAGNGFSSRSVAELLGSAANGYYATAEGQAAIAAALSTLASEATGGHDAAAAASFDVASDHAARFPQLWLDACAVPLLSDVLGRAGDKPAIAGCVVALLCEVLQHTEDAVELPDIIPALPRFVAALCSCAADATPLLQLRALQWCSVLRRLAALPSCGPPLLQAGTFPQLLGVLQRAAAVGSSRNLPLFTAVGGLVLDLSSSAASAPEGACPLLAAAETVYAAADSAFEADCMEAAAVEVVCRLFAHASLAPAMTAMIASGAPSGLLLRLVTRLDFCVSTGVVENVEVIGAIACALPLVARWVPSSAVTVLLRALQSLAAPLWPRPVELLLQAAAAIAAVQKAQAAAMASAHGADELLATVLQAYEGHDAVTKAAFDLWEELAVRR